eukprot:m.492215 g.492215  ORF g.492215 m.492215 type:complete len:405 (+) comp31818_c0_seq1:221-1435(+)
MLARYVHRRERGLHRPSILTKVELTRRTFLLGLSDTHSVEAVHAGGVAALDIDQTEGSFLASGGQDKAVVVYDISKHSKPNTEPVQAPVVLRLPRAHDYNVSAVQWYPNDTGILTTSGMDGSVKVWDTNAERLAREFVGFERVYQHALSRTGHHTLIAVAGQDCTTTLCDVRTGGQSRQLRGHTGKVFAVAWSPSNAELLATGSLDNRCLVWDVRSAAGPLLTLDQHNGARDPRLEGVVTAHDGAVNGLAYTPDGRYLLSTGTDRRARLWNAKTGQNLMVHYPGIQNGARKLLGMCVSQCSSVPVLYHPCGKDIKAYDIHTGRTINTLRAHFGTVQTCTFHPWLPSMYSSSSDNQVLAWTPQVRSELADAAGAAGHAGADVHALDVDAWSDDDGGAAGGGGGQL